jgi:hypothetical protein
MEATAGRLGSRRRCPTPAGVDANPRTAAPPSNRPRKCRANSSSRDGTDTIALIATTTVTASRVDCPAAAWPLVRPGRIQGCWAKAHPTMIAATASGRHSSWLETAAPDQRERAEPLAADDDHGEPAAGGEAAPEKAGVDIDDEARLTSARSPGAARSQRPGPAVADGLAADRHGPVLLDALLPQAHGPAAGARAARAGPR